MPRKLVIATIAIVAMLGLGQIAQANMTNVLYPANTEQFTDDVNFEVPTLIMKGVHRESGQEIFVNLGSAAPRDANEVAQIVTGTEAAEWTSMTEGPNTIWVFKSNKKKGSQIMVRLGRMQISESDYITAANGIVDGVFAGTLRVVSVNYQFPPMPDLVNYVPRPNTAEEAAAVFGGRPQHWKRVGNQWRFQSVLPHGLRVQPGTVADTEHGRSEAGAPLIVTQATVHMLPV